MIPLFDIPKLRNRIGKRAEAIRLNRLRAAARLLRSSSSTIKMVNEEDAKPEDAFHLIIWRKVYNHTVTVPGPDTKEGPETYINDNFTNWNQETFLSMIDDDYEINWNDVDVESTYSYELYDTHHFPDSFENPLFGDVEWIDQYWVQIPDVYTLAELANKLRGERSVEDGRIEGKGYLEDDDGFGWEVLYRITKDSDDGILHEDSFAVPGSVNKQPTFIVRSVEDGINVMNHPDIIKNWKKSLRVKPKHKRAVLVPCAATKPFPEAPSHKHGYLKALQNKDVDIYIVSEPLGIVPYKWSRTYPNDDYDFPPKYVKGDGRDLLVSRFKGWYDKVGKKYDKIYLALPGHHMGLVLQAGIEGVDASISNCRDNTCSDDAFRATTKEYINFLRRKVQ